MSSTHLISSPKSMILYFSAEEVNTLLDHLGTQQIELSNTAFLEDFSNLPSIVLSYKSKTFNLLKALSN
ncbi:4614_t:CDS:1, partial [Dentiscutata heterogama]